MYNYLIRRPHVPRERQLRRIMISQGIPIELDPTPTPRATSSSGTAEGNSGTLSDESDFGVEEGEEEELTDDECYLAFP